MKTKTITAMSALLALTVPAAFAISLDDAAANLLMFEHAALSADYCEKRGYPSRSMYSPWQQKYAHVQRESAKRILSEGERRGLAKTSDQEVMLSEVTAHLNKTASDSIAKKGIPCSKYRAFMDGFHELLKK